MKGIGIGVAVMLVSLAGWKVFREPRNVAQINFSGQNWSFPRTVQEAVSEHQLAYKSPGFYYKFNQSPDYQIRLLPIYQANDLLNEHQPKQHLYNRPIQAYLFKLRDTGLTFDSLLAALRTEYKIPFQIERDSVLVGHQKKEAEALALATLSEHINVGLIKPYTEPLAKKEVTLGIYYDLPLSDLKYSLKSNAY
ncbi:hypothetical protein [Spirosoma oryzicola]|uniref:hypothetical protein n=1 Tax=Spirosoma oryzicola TaxID=2898794 RepID=UPI001E643958|nr:hypothetical protein [Spirosoma oryzicola]UHG92546.1 hypothetical protein LQ777_06465 [Spirosoma oryzicola]